MEGVPRMPMLNIEVKQNYIDFLSLDWAGMPSSEDYYESIQQRTAEALKKHIRDEYGDNPDKFESAINNLLETQHAAYKAMPSPDFEGCTLIKKYFGQLHYMQSRFPFKGENGLKVSFAWQDAFTGFLTEHDCFEFEQTAVLFNIGAIHSFLGASDSRISEEGIRISCVHFQYAAGVFTYLAENFDTTLSPDISQFMLKLFINMCLAQGQECLLEKSMQDNRKSSIVSKICQQVVDYYKQCLQSLENKDSSVALGSSVHKAWKKMTYFKVQYYSAITKYFMGNSALDQDKYGQSVSYFGAAVAHLNELVKLAKGFPKEIKVKVDNALKFTTDVLNGKYNSAVKDNNYVYNDRVPDPATLPEVKGASLVKALPFEPANETITGPDFFAKLVPIEAHLAASTYSEEKAKLLRSVVENIEEKNTIIEQYKTSIELDPKKLIDPNHVMKLEVELIEKCALLNTDQSSITGLKEHMEVLNDVYSELDSVLNDILSIVEKEESDDLKLKDAAGKEAFSVQDDIEGIRRELSVYTELHQKAGQMNEDLQTACRIHIQNMKIVAIGIEGVEEDLKLKEASQLIGEEDKNDIELIRKLCNKVIEMEQQRKSLLEQLRQQMETDDVTSALVTKHGIDQDDLFKEELKKYDTLISTINQNLAAQENIFDAVTEANARYTKIRKVVEAERERIRQRSQNLVLSCTIAPEVSSRCDDGKKFFGEILSKAKGLYDRVKEFQDENDERRKEIYKKIEERKKPPPRPSAPKPKIASSSEKKPDLGSAKLPKPGTILSPEVLAKMMAEDDDELLNDPEFLLFLQNQGDMQYLTAAIGDPVSQSLPQPVDMMPKSPPMPSPGRNIPPMAQLPQTSVVVGPTRSLSASLPPVNQPYHPSSMSASHQSVMPPNVSQHVSHPGVAGQLNASVANVSAGAYSLSEPISQHSQERVPGQIQNHPNQIESTHGMAAQSQYQQINAPRQRYMQHPPSSTYQTLGSEGQVPPNISVPPCGVASQYQQINTPPHQNLYNSSSMYQPPTGQMNPANYGIPQGSVAQHQGTQLPPSSGYQFPAGQTQIPPSQAAPLQSTAQIYDQPQQNLQYSSASVQQTTANIHSQPQQIPPVPASSAQFQPHFSRQYMAPQPHGQMMHHMGSTPHSQPQSSERYHVVDPHMPPAANSLNLPPHQPPHQMGYSAHQYQSRVPVSQTLIGQHAMSQVSTPQGQFVHPSVQVLSKIQPNYLANAQLRPQVLSNSQQTAGIHPSGGVGIPGQHPGNQNPIAVGQQSRHLQPQHSTGNLQSLPVSSQQPYQNRNASAVPQAGVPFNSMVQSSMVHQQPPRMSSSGTGMVSNTLQLQGNQNPQSPSQNLAPSGSAQYPSVMQVSHSPVVRPTLAISQQANMSSQVNAYSMAPSGTVMQQNATTQYNVPASNSPSGIHPQNLQMSQGQFRLSNPQQQGIRDGAMQQIAAVKPGMNQNPMPMLQGTSNHSINRMTFNQPPLQYSPRPAGISENQWQNRAVLPENVQPRMTQPAGFSTQSSAEFVRPSGPVHQQTCVSHLQGGSFPPSTVSTQMHAPMRQPLNTHRPIGNQQYRPTPPMLQRNPSQQQLIRPPGPSSYNQSVPGTAVQPQLHATARESGDISYQPRPESGQNQVSSMGVAHSPMPSPIGVQQSPQRSASSMNVNRFQSPQQNVARSFPTPGAHNPAVYQAQSQKNVQASTNVPQRYPPPMQPDQKEGYTFRSHPHVGNVTSIPSNENSPKHMIKQPVSGNAEHQSLGILKPTPVGGSKVLPDSQCPGQPSMDLAGLVLTPRRTVSSSADELLLNAPEQPTVLTKESSQGMLIPTKIDEVDDNMVVRPIEGLPYMDEADLMHFKIQVTELRRKVSNLLNKPDTIGLCELDREWKQLSESQEKHSRKLSTAVARCSSYKNRYQDIVPFDQSRIVLKAAKDDYINASLIDGVSPYCPRFLAAQSPLPNTVSDFWLMVYEQQVNIIVMLVNSKDVPKKCPVYWPADRTVPQQHGPLTVSFTTSKTHGDLYIERTFTIKHKNQSLAMSVTQLQYIAWPEHRLPSSASDLLSFLGVVQSYHSSQRNLQWPILVHCDSGVGRTGVFCAFVAAINEINAGMGIPSVVDILTKMRLKRKYMVQEKAQLKFVYDIILYHAIDVLKQRNVVLMDESKPLPMPTQQTTINQDVSHMNSGSFDIFSNQSALSSIQATVEKMTIKSAHEQELSASGASFVPYVEPKSLDNSNPVSLSVMQTPPSRKLSTQGMNVAMDERLVASPPKFVEMSDLVQGTISPVSNTDPAETAASSQVNTPKPPDVVESCNNYPVGNIAGLEASSSDTSQQQVTASGVSNLMETMTPESFTLNLGDGGKKQRISKADFYKPTAGLSVEKDASDPFSAIDPLWGLQKL